MSWSLEPEAPIQEKECSTVSLSFPSYYRANEVQQFSYSRPFRKGEKDPDNEFAVSAQIHLLKLGMGALEASPQQCTWQK